MFFGIAIGKLAPETVTIKIELVLARSVSKQVGGS